MAIFLYYDKQGKLLELVNDDTIRLGNNNANTIYFYIDEEPNFTSKTITFERSDGTKSNEYAITESASLSLPYSKTRNYKYFKDFAQYDFSSYTVPSDILSVNGAYKATIRCIANDGTIFALGEFSFNVQTNVVKDDQNLTQSQYDYIWGLWGDLKNDIHTTIENTETALQDVQDAITSMNEQVNSTLEDLKGQVQDSIDEINNANVGGIRVNESKELAIANKSGTDLVGANSKVTLGRLLEVQSNTINVEECLDLGTLIPEGGKLSLTNVGDYNLIAGTIDSVRYVFTKYGIIGNNIVYFNLSFKDNKTYVAFIFVDKTEFVYTISTINLVDIDTLKLYQLDLTDEQMLAVNSGITSEKVATYDNYATSKQDTLVSGTNIKTFNGESILTSGNVVIPTTTEELTNNSGFITSASLTWENITNRPTDLGDFSNSAGYIKSDALTPYLLTETANSTFVAQSNYKWSTLPEKPTNVSSFTNDAGYITNAVSNLTNYYTKTEVNGLHDELRSDLEDLVNSADLTWENIKNKPTKLSEFINDSGFITSTVSNLANYYTKTQIDSKGYLTSVSWSDIADRITKVSQLQNDTGFITNSVNNLVNYYSKTELDTKFEGYVSDEDFTWQNLASKPTALSAFTNDTGFITNTVNNLTNYYLKSETYTKSEVNKLISGLSTLKILKVDELPETGEENVIYLVPNNPTTRAVVNNCTEYIWQDGNYEVIGSTQVDLSNYPQLSGGLVNGEVLLGASANSLKTSGLTISNTYVNSPNVLLTGQAIAGELANFGSIASLATVATTGSYNDLVDKPTIPNNTNQLTNGAGFITASALTPYATKTELGSYLLTANFTWEKLSGKPTIPSKTSQLSNDSGFVTQTTLNNYLTTSDASTTYLAQENFTWDNLGNKPSIPTSTGDLMNDSGFITNSALAPYLTSANAQTTYLAKTDFTWAGLGGKPTIPSKTSDLQNDSGFITNTALSGYLTQTSADARYLLQTNFSWANIPDKPTIPSKTSELSNDSGFINSSALAPYLLASNFTWANLEGKPTLSTVATSGSYNDLTEKPTIPTNNNQLTNGAGYINQASALALIKASNMTGSIPTVTSIDNPTTNSPSLVIYNGELYYLSE